MQHNLDLHIARAMEDVNSCYLALRPPKRITVAEGAAQTLVVKQPGLPIKPWEPAETPYMVEPMNMLASRVHEACCFVGPARSGKTLGFTDAWGAHVIANDPGDMMIVQMSQEKAREFSKTRIDRMLEASPKLAALKSRFAQDDNTHDKRFKHGMWLRIAWPTSTNLSGSDYRYVSIPDYDRTPDDVNGEGSKYALALKRVQSFMSRGMLAVESSPGRPVVDPSWRASSAHEAPAVGGDEGTGILGIYNMGDRRRWYWACPDCRRSFEAAPGLSLFRLPAEEELLEIVRDTDVMKFSAEYDRIYCPHCNAQIKSKFKADLNRGGIWLRDGQTRDEDGNVHGEGANSTVASFWLGGVAASYQPWRSIVSRHMNALRDYAVNGSEQLLKTVTNVDQAMPYTSRHLMEAKKRNKDPQERDDSGLQRYIVPHWTRCVIVSVDVQGGSTARFVVQAHAVGPFGEQALVDRYDIKHSKRPGMGEEFAPIDPSRYAEDWDLLTDKIVRATFRTPIENREIRVKLTVIDAAGEEGVYEKALAYYRRMRALGLTNRIMLTKGNNTKTEWVIKETLVGRRNTNEDGDVKLYLLNPNELADQVMTGISRQIPGPGYIHFPQVRSPKNPGGYITQAFFDELKAEVRSENGVWQQIKPRNETFDLCKMIRAGMLRLQIDKIQDWNNLSALPTWLYPLEENSECITSDERRAMQQAALAAAVSPGETEAPKVRVAFQRRRSASPV